MKLGREDSGWAEMMASRARTRYRIRFQVARENHGPSLACRPVAHDARYPGQAHETRDAGPPRPPRRWVSVPLAPQGPAGHAGHRPAGPSDRRGSERVLLARARLSAGQAASVEQRRLLATQTRKESPATEGCHRSLISRGLDGCDHLGMPSRGGHQGGARSAPARLGYEWIQVDTYPPTCSTADALRLLRVLPENIVRPETVVG
jgi:hypothetical protein